jgi:hypothetical protein
MRVTFRILVGGCLFLWGGHSGSLKAQEDVANPEVAPADANVPEGLDSSSAATGENWRYRQHEGRWWYLLPDNRWVVWSDGAWIDPPTHAVESESGDGLRHQAAPRYVIPSPSPAARFLQPRPRSWYFTGRVYDGPYYYYDEFYKPYGGARPYPYYPEPRPYTRRPYSYGRPYYGQPGVGVSIGGGSGIGIGVGF